MHGKEREKSSALLQQLVDELIRGPHDGFMSSDTMWKRPDCLTLQGPVVDICTARFNINKFRVLPTQLYLCVLCGSKNKQRLFPYTELNDWFL